MTRGEIVISSKIETYTICGINLLVKVIKSEKRRVDLGDQMGISNIYQGRLQHALTRIHALVKGYNLNRFDLKSLVYHYMMSEVDPVVRVNEDGVMMYTSPATIKEEVMSIDGRVRTLGKIDIDYNVQNRYLLKVQYINTLPIEIIGDPVLYIDAANMIKYTMPLKMPLAYSVIVPDTQRHFTLWNMNIPPDFTMRIRGNVTEQSVQSFLSKSSTLLRIHPSASLRESQYFIIEHGPISRNVLVLKAFDRMGDMLNVLNADMLALVTSIWNQIKRMTERPMDLAAKIEISTTFIDTFPTNGISSVLSKLKTYVLMKDNKIDEIFDDQAPDVMTIASYIYSRLMYIFDIEELQYVDRTDTSRLFEEEELIYDKITRNVEIIRTLTAIIKMYMLMKYIRGIVNNVGNKISPEDVKFILAMSEYSNLSYEFTSLHYESLAREEYLKFEEMFKRTGNIKEICVNFADTLITNYAHISDLINKND